MKNYHFCFMNFISNVLLTISKNDINNLKVGYFTDIGLMGSVEDIKDSKFKIILKDLIQKNFNVNSTQPYITIILIYIKRGSPY